MHHKTNSGNNLNQKWGIGARQTLFHKDGNFYECLRRFPGALFDPEGYLYFSTEEEYLSTSYLSRGIKLNVPGGIANVPGYVLSI